MAAAEVARAERSSAADEPLLARGRRSGPSIPGKLDRQYPELWELYKKHLACFWVAEELDLQADLKDWHGLKPEERHFITHVLAFFAASDGMVLENLNLCFAEEVTAPEAKAFYSIQAAMENVHSETYSLLIQSYISDPDEREDVFNAIETMPAVKAKAEWAAQWMGSTRAFAERLVAFACVEGILFSGSFCAIFWLKKRGLMPGLSVSNQLISRDEGLHTEFACALYRRLQRRLDDETAHVIVRGAVDAEELFICESLPSDLIGINAASMAQYIRMVADRLLSSLGHPILFGAVNPFDWMEMISMQGKTNFFESRVSEYSKANSMTEPEQRGFRLDVEF